MERVNKLLLGSASTCDVGTDRGDVVQLDPQSGKLPAVDGSLLLNLPSVQGVLYTFVQNAPATAWTINHNLNAYPSITVIDSAGTLVEGSYQYTSANQIVLTFAMPFSGTAYLN